jgi:hypothetical protein
MRESVVEEDVASGAQIFRVPRLLILGAQSYTSDMTLVKLRAHDLVSCRASCPLDSGYSRDIRRRWYQLVPGLAIRVG